jgi:hypothetical protein
MPELPLKGRIDGGALDFYMEWDFEMSNILPSGDGYWSHLWRPILVSVEQSLHNSRHSNPVAAIFA